MYKCDYCLNLATGGTMLNGSTWSEKYARYLDHLNCCDNPSCQDKMGVDREELTKENEKDG